MESHNLHVLQSLRLKITAFSQFLTKEIASSRNIKDRQNRQKVHTTLTRLYETMKNIDISNYKNGMFIFTGFNDYDQFICQIIEPYIEYNGFYYSCSSKFVIDESYFIKKYGSITFIDGEITYIYVLINGSFVKFKTVDGNLVKRHKKGGQSAQRFDRIAEESRANYITRVVDNINLLRNNQDFEKYTNWVFGSDEIRNMLLDSRKLQVKINDGGFLNFNNRTIELNNWVKYLDKSESHDDKYDEILLYLDTDVDMLEFDPSMKDSLKYYISDSIDNNRNIPIPKDIKYRRLFDFKFIGVKYYSNDF